jgi:small-conductance mechanosensitive channel
MPDALQDQLPTLGWIAVSLLIVISAGPLVGIVAKRMNRDHPKVGVILDRARNALTAILVILGAKIVLAGVGPGDQVWGQFAQHGLTIAFIASVVWFLCVAASALEELMLRKYAPDAGSEDVRIRRARTSISLLRRLAVAIIISIGVALILMTFPGVSALGAGIIASAGLLSIVAGLAAQSSLTNVFAGIQLAFGDALRIDDVIVVDGQSGTVDDITLTYVVVHLWDDRRLILPSSYFISRPFENWTRSRARISGSVVLEVDWSAPLDRMREELNRILDASPLWDQRTGMLRVVDVTKGTIRVGIELSATDTRKLFALQAEVREAMVRFLVLHGQDGLPKSRSQNVTAGGNCQVVE